MLAALPPYKTEKRTRIFFQSNLVRQVYAAKVGELRSALLEAVTPADIRAVLEALVTEAKAGNVQAMREFFNRVLGQPQAVDAIERLGEVEDMLNRLEDTVTGGGVR